MGDVKLHFVSKFAKFENWEEGYDVMRETLAENKIKIESRMNMEENIPENFNPDIMSGNSPLPPGMMAQHDDDVPF